MRLLVTATAALAVFALAAPAAAGDHSDVKIAPDNGGQDVAMNVPLMQVLASDFRADDRARDQYRRPIETLAFFRVEPTQTVVEYAPGGGWYTRILAPYVAQSGKYIAVEGDSDLRTFRSEAAAQRTRSWPQRFPETVSGWTGIDASKIHAFESDEIPQDVAGRVDRILIFRSMHGLLNGNRADAELRNLRAMLADDGMVGVVQHRARADQPYDMATGRRGYLKQDDVIALFKAFGFDLVDSSEINANPKDTADWERGVWTLPPVLRNGAKDREKYTAIGESDRMTLLFKKAK